MPRPGPRPYECVRRAWHSDRHQPIRGSLIQEIFRVVNEIHSSATKKNREWQEKLPIVVLKAEEIMYSKANSEAEYMDPKTLWDRANDAINTIIRRDESSETGGFLQPCIEAALNLGCTPRRASRSQRNNNQRCYLNPNNQEPTSSFSIILDNKTQGTHTTTLDHMSYPSLVNFQTMKLNHFGLEPVCFVAQNNNCSDNKFPSSSHYFPPSNNQCLSKETCPASKSYSVYPLYYGNNLQVNESQLGFEIPPKSNSSAVEPADMGIIQNHFPYDADASKKTRQTEPGDTPENQPFDLSLRLAPLSVPCSTHNSLSLKVEDVISSKSREGIKSSNLLPQMGKGFSFFHLGNADIPSDSCLSKWSPQEATMRKRKTNVSHPTEERILCSPPKRQRFHCTTLMEE